jgi:hypothetical protein
LNQEARALGADIYEIGVGTAFDSFVVLVEQGAAGMLRAPRVLIASATALAPASGACQMAAEGLRHWVHRI